MWVDRDASCRLPICTSAEISVVQLSPDPIPKFTLISGSHFAFLDILHGLHGIGSFSGAPEYRLPAIMLQIWPSGWRIILGTRSGLSKWYHKPLSQVDSQSSPYQWYSRWLFQSQHRMGRPEIEHACWRSYLPLSNSLLLQHFPFEQVFWRICFRDWLPWSRLPAIVVVHDVGIIYQKACVQQVLPIGFRSPIAQLPSANQHLTV